jgi:hypothetical protein
MSTILLKMHWLGKNFVKSCVVEWVIYIRHVAMDMNTFYDAKWPLIYFQDMKINIIWKFHFYTKLILDTLKQLGQLVMCTTNSQNDDTVPWQQQPFCSSSSLYRWITMIIDIRYIIVLYWIVWFDQKKVFYLSFTATNDIRPHAMHDVDNWQMQVIVVWNALWYVWQWYHALTYIDYECRKYLMHRVLLYIKKLMAGMSFWIFAMCLFVYNESTSLIQCYCIS